jgi:histidinol-phosphate/aromatic aminotransferase/cobyric acid decarboxylase-like protein
VPNQPKNPMLGWRPPAELSAWARAEAARRGVGLKVVLDEALSEYRERRGPATELHSAIIASK